MTKELWWWSAIIVVVVTLISISIVDANKQNQQFENCKRERIRAFPEKFFTWDGMLELNQAGLYQPKCI